MDGSPTSQRAADLISLQRSVGNRAARIALAEQRVGPGLDRTALTRMIWSLAMTRARLGDIDNAMTEAMTYGEYEGPEAKNELIARIQAIVHGPTGAGGSS